MQSYKFNIVDNIVHTSHLSEIEDLALRRMLDWIFLHETALPESIDEIARLIRLKSHQESIEKVLEEFFYIAPDGFMHEFAHHQLTKHYKNLEEKQ